MHRLLAAVLAAALAAAGHPGPSAASSITAASISDAAPNDADDTAPSLVARAEIAARPRAFLARRNRWPRRRQLPQRRPRVSGGPRAGGHRKAGRSHLERARIPRSAPVLKSYTISDADLAGPFTKAIPAQLEAMARLPGLSYTSPLAELAEKFHMSQDLLHRLNPRADFERAGTQIIVADVPEMKLAPRPPCGRSGSAQRQRGPVAATIVVDKPARNVRAYDQNGKLLPSTRPRLAARKNLRRAVSSR